MTRGVRHTIDSLIFIQFDIACQQTNSFMYQFGNLLAFETMVFYCHWLALFWHYKSFLDLLWADVQIAHKRINLFLYGLFDPKIEVRSKTANFEIKLYEIAKNSSFLVYDFRCCCCLFLYYYFTLMYASLEHVISCPN